MWCFLPDMMSSTAFSIFMGQGYYLDLPLAMEIMGLMDKVRGPLHHFQHLRRQVTDIYIALRRVQNYLGIEEIEVEKVVENK